MLKSINMWALQDNDSRPAEDLFDEVRRHGFQAIELTVGDADFRTLVTDQAGCEALLGAAAQAGIMISSLASGLGWKHPLSSADDQVRARGTQIQQDCLRIGGWLGVDCMLLVPGMVSGFDAEGPDHVPYDQALDNMHAAISELVPVAEEAGVVVGVENVWNKVLLSPLEMCDFIDSFGSECVGAYLDVGNMIVTGYAEDWVRILGERIGCVHFKDFRRAVGTLDGFCDLLEGDVNYPAVVEALRDVGYDGPVVAEFFGLQSEALQKVSDAMDRILAM